MIQVKSSMKHLYDFDSLFLLPKCAFTSDKAMSLRKDLQQAGYNFNIKVLENTPSGNVNVWLCKFVFKIQYSIYCT